MIARQHFPLLKRHNDVQAQDFVSSTKKIWFKLFWLRCGDSERGVPALFFVNFTR